MKSYWNSIEFCKNSVFHDFGLIWMYQVEKFKRLWVHLQIAVQNFRWKLLPIDYRMIYLSYFLNRWLKNISLLKITFLIWNPIKIPLNSIESYNRSIFHDFDWFQCVNFKNSNLCEYTSKICVKHFVDEHYYLIIEWCTYHIFWIGGCKINSSLKIAFRCRNRIEIQ